MNKQCYRVIFNRARQMLMVVSELAKNHSADKTRGSQSGRGTHLAVLRPISLSLGLLFGSVTPVWAAGVVADGSAPGNQQPTIIAGANGTPQVNIQAPNSSGVSHNKYQNFDVDKNGVILNNSAVNTQTQLGGLITGNPWLAKGEASVILNEVNSSNPSQLNGFIEVAGKRADVIIANPAGITCSGCGFINANKTTLAAAQVLLEQGKIAGFDVKNGQIAIQGNGLNDEHSDYTQLIARAVKINAKLHAKDLLVTTGKNRTDANGSVLSTELSADEAPEFAVDVANLGGMYANKIRLVGTEKGVGVRNTGHLGAQAGDFVLNANGKLINTGIITASQDTEITLNGNLTNQGNVTAGKNLTLTTSGDIDNTGNLVAGNNLSIAGQNVVSRQGSLLGAGINADGKVTQSGSLTVNTTQSQSLNGKTIAHDDITLTGSALSLSGSQTQGKNLTLNSQSTLSTQHATVNATGDLTLTATHWDNTQGQVVANKEANLRGQGLHVINRDGEVKAGTTLNLSAEQIDGEGKWLSLNDMNLTVKNDISQTGQWIANNTLNVTSSGHIRNKGQVSAKALTVNSADFTNQTAGEVLADTLHIQTQNTLTNTGLLNGNQVVLKTNHLSNRGTGRIYGDQIAIAAATLDNIAENDKAAVIASRGDLDLGVGTLNNTTHSLLFNEGNFTLGGALDANYRATGRADTVNNHSAYLESLGNMFLTLTHLNNINDHFVTELQRISQTLIKEYQIWGERFDVTKYTVYLEPDDNDDVMYACVQGRGCDDSYQVLDYLRTIEETRIKETDPAKIVAGKNLTIDASGTVTNDKSQIVAGNTLDIQAATLNNIDVPGERHITDVGTIEYWYRVRHKGNDSQGRDKSDYAPGTKIEAITLYPSTLEEHQQTPPTTNETPADYDSARNPSAVVTQPPVVTLPDNSLFTVKPGSDSNYLIETDPQFTNRKQWLGTDYMQKAMLSDHNNVHKRLGDGYYEQRLIREQVIALSGQRYLEGYADDEAQFQALMDAGLRAQSAFNLRPGIALSAEQMENLTENMVWLVSRDVSLPDGTVETVLVPQVYLKKDSLQLDGSGALLSGQKIQIAVNEDVTNSGRLIGGDISVFANNITQQSGHVQGDTVTMTAKNDLTQQGGAVQATHSLVMVAGNNLTLSSTTRDTNNQAGNNQFSSTYLSDQASVYVGGKDGKLTLQAGNDVTLAAAAIGAQGENSQIAVEAGRNLQLNTVKTQASEYTEAGSNHRITRTSSQDIGSSVQGNGTITLNAGQDITATAATVSADKALTVTAGRDITVAAGEQNQTHDEYHKVTGGNGALSKTTTETQFTYDRTTANSSTLSGDSVALSSGRDTTVSGSNVMADNDVTVQAGRDLIVTTADENKTEHYYKKETTSGITSSGGIGFTAGKSQMKQTTDTDSNQKKGSVIGSTAGNVTLTAGNTATIHGSDVIAAKDINVTASDINITAAENTRTDVTTTETKSSGLSVSLGGAVGSALNTAYQTGKAAQETDDGQLKALQGIKAGLKLEQANQAGQLAAAQNPGSDITNNGSFGVDVSYGSSSSKSTSKTEQKTASGSSLTAGDNLTLNATGNQAGSQGNIHVQGSTLSTDKDLTLNAKNDITLSSATNTQTVDSKNESQGSSIGVGITAGQGGAGWNVNASVSKGSGFEKGNSQYYTDTEVNAGKTLTINSGKDTTLTGAQASGETVKMDVGGDLTLSSQQETDKYDSKQQNISVSGSGGMGNGSFSANADKTTMHSNYQSVNNQTGIHAGQGGFDITVGDHTQLDGAVISSDASKDKNTLDTGTIGFTDINNKAEYTVEQQSVGVNTGGSIANQVISNSASALLSGVNNKGKDSNTTQSAVAEGDLIVRDTDKQTQNVANLSRDTDNAHEKLGTIFDKDEEQKRIDRNQLIGEIGQQIKDIAVTDARIKATEKINAENREITDAEREIAKKELAEQGKDTSNESADNYIKEQAIQAEINKSAWGVGGDNTRLVDAGTALIQGLANGDVNAAVANASAPYIANAIGKYVEGDAGKLAAHAIANVALALAKDENALSQAAGAVTAEAMGMLSQELYKKDVSQLTEEEKSTLSAFASLAAGIAGGLVGGETQDALNAAQAGKTTVENNYLSEKEARQLDKDLAACKAEGRDCRPVLQEYIDISNKNSQELIEACTGGGVACVTWEEVIMGHTNVANDEHPLQIRLTEKLKDPDAAALVNYLNGSDLKFLKDNITDGDRILDVVMTPTSWPVMVLGTKNILTNSVTKGKEQLIAVGVSGVANAGIQYGVTGEVKLSDVIGAGVIGSITAGKGYNPTVTWNALGGYYQAEIKGDDPFMGGLLSKTGASVGYGTSNIIKIPFDKVLNPVSKQYEWVPTGVWTITKPVPQNPIPNLVGNAVGSGASESTIGKLPEVIKSDKNND